MKLISKKTPVEFWFGLGMVILFSVFFSLYSNKGEKEKAKLEQYLHIEEINFFGHSEFIVTDKAGNAWYINSKGTAIPLKDK